MISKEQVIHIAKLARIHLDESEVEKFQKDLGPILDYFETLNKVDVSGVEPMIHSVLLENQTRSDETDQTLDGKAEDLVEMAPEKKDGFVQVKSIL